MNFYSVGILQPSEAPKWRIWTSVELEETQERQMNDDEKIVFIFMLQKPLYGLQTIVLPLS